MSVKPELGKGNSKCHFPSVFPSPFPAELGPFHQLFVLSFVLICEGGHCEGLAEPTAEDMLSNVEEINNPTNDPLLHS